MKKPGLRFVGLAAVFALLLGAGPASAATGSKWVEGTVYDTTCGIVTQCGSPCPPPCGPIPAPQSRADLICAEAQRRIVCPLTRTGNVAPPEFCIQGLPCGVSDPLYPGEGGVVKVRRRGSATVLATTPIVGGHFKLRLPPGEYALHPFLSEPRCWSGTTIDVLVSPQLKGPVPASLWVTNSCVAHPDDE